MSSRNTDNSARRGAAIRRVVEEAMGRRAAGVKVDDREIIEANPGLMPDLGEELRLLAVLERVRGPSSGGAKGLENLYQSRLTLARDPRGGAQGFEAVGVDGVPRIDRGLVKLRLIRKHAVAQLLPLQPEPDQLGRVEFW